MRLLIGSQFRPELDALGQFGGTKLQINKTASDPITTCSFSLWDQGSVIALDAMQEVVVIDEDSIPNPAQNLLVNPLLNPYTSIWSNQANTGVTLSQAGGGGVTLTYANAPTAGNTALWQYSPKGYGVPGQSYMLSCYVSGTAVTNIQAFLVLGFYDVAQNQISVVNSAKVTPTGTPTRMSVSGVAPAGTVYVSCIIATWQTNATNSGTVTYTKMQLEPMWFTSLGQAYPSPDCYTGAVNCYVMPDGTCVRQQRMFGGFVNHFVYGPYEGKNRPIAVDCVNYGWLLAVRFWQGPSPFTNAFDDTIIKNIVQTPYPTQFTFNHVQRGVQYTSVNWAWGSFVRDIISGIAGVSGFRWFVDDYWDIWYLPTGFYTTGYNLSDKPDAPMVTSHYVVRALGSTLLFNSTRANPAPVLTFTYSNYTHETDFTQPASVASVTESGGSNYVKVIHAGSQAQYFYAFDRLISDSTISNDSDAYSRGLAEVLNFAYARHIFTLEIDQKTPQTSIAPGYGISFSNSLEGITDRTLLIQKVTINYQGTDVTTGKSSYLYQLELGDFNPSMLSHIIKRFREVTQPGATLLTQTAIHVITNENISYDESASHTP